MFELNQLECHVTSVSPNAENMGVSGDTKLGLSIYIRFIGSNELLDMFDKKLRPALYERAAGDQQEDLMGHLPIPKFKLEKPICWPYIGSGYTVIIHTLLDLEEEIELQACKVDKFQFAIGDEGRVSFTLRIYAHPATEQVGPLCELTKHDIKLSLMPAKVAEQTAQKQAQEPSPQADMINETAAKDAMDVLYPRALAAVRATQNPSASALQTELKIGFNHAAKLLARMFEEGIIIRDHKNKYICAPSTTAKSN